MDIERGRELAQKYAICQECGSDKIGAGEGLIHIDDMEFSRLCKCGWRVTIDESLRDILSMAINIRAISSGAIGYQNTIRKWDFVKHEYQSAENKYGAVLVTEPFDADEIIRCTNCGKEITAGESMVSKQWHNEIGFGFPVCVECHKIEWDKYRAEKEKNKAHE